MQDNQPPEDLSNPDVVSDIFPTEQGSGSVTGFCNTCPNWLEIEFTSRIPANMPNYLAIAGMTAADVKVDEAGNEFVVCDAEQEIFEYRGKLDGNGFARINIPSGIEEVQFAMGSERPDEVLGVPEGEQPDDNASDEWWIMGVARGALTGVERGINEIMHAADDFGFWVGWNPGYVKVNDEWVWMSTDERKAYFDRYGYVDFLDIGVDRPTGTAGRVTEGVIQFLVGFIPAVRAVRLVKAASVIGTTGQYMVAGAIADATVFDPHERRLSDLVQEFPQLKNPVSEYLASDRNDSSAEGRLKNALEGLIFGAVLDRFVAALRVMKYGMSRMVITVKTQYRYRFDSESLEAVVYILIRAARAVEPPITRSLQDLARRFNGRMAGLDFRFKSEESLARKISGKAVEDKKLYSEVAESIKDVLRYTIVFPEGEYAAGVRAAADALVTQGNKQVKFRNAWAEGSGYQGINANYKTPQGFIFEIQFHTSASLAAKEGDTHALYEQLRVLSNPNSAEARRLKDQMDKIFAAVPVPPNAANLK